MEPNGTTLASLLAWSQAQNSLPQSKPSLLPKAPINPAPPYLWLTFQSQPLASFSASQPGREPGVRFETEIRSNTRLGFPLSSLPAQQDVEIPVPEELVMGVLKLAAVVALFGIGIYLIVRVAE